MRETSSRADHFPLLFSNDFLEVGRGNLSPVLQYFPYLFLLHESSSWQQQTPVQDVGGVSGRQLPLWVDLNLRYQPQVHSGTRELVEVRQIETWPFNALIVIGLRSQGRSKGSPCGL
jgi:hypothetical protein